MLAAVLASVLMLALPAECKKKKVKTTFKALKCSACKAIADEMRAEIQHEWETKAGDTVLVEKVRPEASCSEGHVRGRQVEDKNVQRAAQGASRVAVGGTKAGGGMGSIRSAGSRKPV